METVIDHVPVDSTEDRVPADGLFVVWFDIGCGHLPANWWWEMPGPQPLSSALDQAAEMRAGGWICMVVPEDCNPRPDGRWDNPSWKQ